MDKHCCTDERNAQIVIALLKAHEVMGDEASNQHFSPIRVAINLLVSISQMPK